MTRFPDHPRRSGLLRRLLGLLFLIWNLALAPCAFAAGEGQSGTLLAHWLTPLLAEHPDRSGAFVLEKGEEALLARAWLADQAQASIDVQYFIWSTDNIGILAAEALLRAAERGVHVRVIVDDLLVDANDESLLALAAHPNIEIRIYNPRHSVGVSKAQQIFYLAEDFRASNQRMHDKTFMVDGRAAITGGRNMADEYFDYDHSYNFRDRDTLLLGPVVADMEASFENFWQSRFAMPVEGQLRGRTRLSTERCAAIYADLHRYARDPANFAPEVRAALARIPDTFPWLVRHLAWDEVRFIHDVPGKNSGTHGLAGGGVTTTALAETLQRARRRIVIQSPYLIFPPGALDLFTGLVARGVEIAISTNSLASTDNLQAFSGYRKQRRKILAAGIKIFEFRPAPAVEKLLIARYAALEKSAPTFALHAKTMVIDGETLFVGTFNLDPRSSNLNTEVGVLIHSQTLAGQVEAAIRRDMQPENSWDPAQQDPDSEAGWGKRLRLWFWERLPLDALL